VKAPEFIVAPKTLKNEGRIHLSSQERYHMVQVKRLEPGRLVRLVDGMGNIVHARIKRITAKQVILEKTGPLKSEDDLVPLKVILAIIKGERMDMAVSRLSEIGVSQIQPVTTRRTVVRLPETKLNKRWQRWQALSLHSLKQCRGVKATRILRPLEISEVLSMSLKCAVKIFLCEEHRAIKLSKIFEIKQVFFPMAIAVGPEGGFDPGERQLLLDNGFQPAGIGPRILRSETAAIFGAAVISEFFRTGDGI
jgi:16S rRNA (uracil1498-N3)-methyltransferase